MVTYSVETQIFETKKAVRYTMREWLKDLRMKKGLSKSDMAAKLKISRQYYGYIENGERQPSLDFNLATQISDILKVSLNKIRECEESRVRQ